MCVCVYGKWTRSNAEYTGDRMYTSESITVSCEWRTSVNADYCEVWADSLISSTLDDLPHSQHKLHCVPITCAKNIDSVWPFGVPFRCCYSRVPAIYYRKRLQWRTHFFVSGSVSRIQTIQFYTINNFLPGDPSHLSTFMHFDRHFSFFVGIFGNKWRESRKNEINRTI